MSLISTKQLWFVITLSVIILAVSIWFGGQDRWQQSGFNFEDPGTENLAEKLQGLIQEEPTSPIPKYNLANLYHRLGKYEDAKALLLEVLNSKDLDREILEKSLFNLGNNFFQVAEREKKPDLSLEKLKESLTYYRDLIDRYKRRVAIGETTDVVDPDLIYNTTLVRQRIKILMDLIKKEEKAQEGQKSIYEILTGLVSRELQLEGQLKKLETMENPLGKKSKRDQLLKEREKIGEEITLLRTKISQQLQSSKPQPASIKKLSPKPHPLI